VRNERIVPHTAASAGIPVRHHGFIRRSAGIAAALSVIVGLVAIGAAPASASSNGGGGGGGHSGGNGWNTANVPLPGVVDAAGHVTVNFVPGFNTAKVADVVSTDQTNQTAADAATFAFYAEHTACTVDTRGAVNVQFTVNCPKGSATVVDIRFGEQLAMVFRLK
jgi:hypothetical protein